ncbi:unnamed protein product, partial [Notodromas monacha]
MISGTASTDSWASKTTASLMTNGLKTAFAPNTVDPRNNIRPDEAEESENNRWKLAFSPQESGLRQSSRNAKNAPGNSRKQQQQPTNHEDADHKRLTLKLRSDESGQKDDEEKINTDVRRHKASASHHIIQNRATTKDHMALIILLSLSQPPSTPFRKPSKNNNKYRITETLFRRTKYFYVFTQHSTRGDARIAIDMQPLPRLAFASVLTSSLVILITRHVSRPLSYRIPMLSLSVNHAHRFAGGHAQDNFRLPIAAQTLPPPPHLRDCDVTRNEFFEPRALSPRKASGTQPWENLHKQDMKRSVKLMDQGRELGCRMEEVGGSRLESCKKGQEENSKSLTQHQVHYGPRCAPYKWYSCAGQSVTEREWDRIPQGHLDGVHYLLGVASRSSAAAGSSAPSGNSFSVSRQTKIPSSSCIVMIRHRFQNNLKKYLGYVPKRRIFLTMMRVLTCSTWFLALTSAVFILWTIFDLDPSGKSKSASDVHGKPAFIGYLPDLLQLTDWRTHWPYKELKTNDLNTFFRISYRDKFLRSNLSLKLDHQSEIFQIITADEDEVQLEEKGSEIQAINLNKHQQKYPLVISGGDFYGRSKKIWLSNYLPNNWKPEYECLECKRLKFEIRFSHH